jgi:hypothetical protein
MLGTGTPASLLVTAAQGRAWIAQMLKAKSPQIHILIEYADTAKQLPKTCGGGPAIMTTLIS